MFVVIHADEFVKRRIGGEKKKEEGGRGKNAKRG